MNSLKRSQGSTLIEVLIALIVVAIGLLGVAKLNLEAMKSNQTSLQRSAATMLSYSIMDRMRANRTKAEEGAYNVALPTGNDSCAVPAGASGLAKADLTEWLISEIPSHLGPDACGSVNCTNVGNCAVSIQWWEQQQATKQDDDSMNGDDAQTVLTIEGAL